MPNKIKPKRSYTTNAVPTAADLEINELAINWADGIAYTKNGSGQIVSFSMGGGGGSGSSGLTWSSVPASPTASGTAGQIAYDGEYFYLATATDTWRRAGLATWGGDPYFSNVSLLLRMDGSNGSTTFADSSGNSLAITASGNAQISTAQSKFGGTSGLFDGDGDSLTINAGTPLQFGTSGFTVEAWVYVTSLGSYHALLDGRASPSFSNYTFGIYNVSGTLRLDHVNAGGGGTRLTGTSTSVPLNEWAHVAWVRTGDGDMSCYVNGTKDSSTVYYPDSLDPAGSTVLIGAVVDPQYFYGYIDEMRITKGVARYTANFTPPTVAFPDY